MKRTIALVMTLTVALTGPVVAQESQEQEPQELDLRATEFIYVEGSLPFVPSSNTIATKLPLSLELTPSHIGLVPRALFDEQYGRVLGDALHNVSNVNVQPGFGVHDFFVVRGFDSLSSSLVLTDGAPEPEATFYQLYNVELVEVLKGPGGFLYGSNPLAGAVNLVRKQPDTLRRLNVGAAFGSFSTLEGTADANYASSDGTLMGRVNAMYRGAESWRDNKESDVIGLNPSLTWRPGADRTLNLNFEYLQSDFTPEAGIPTFGDAAVDVDEGTDYNSPLDLSEQDVVRFQADYETRVSDSLTIRDKLYYRGLDWKSDGTLIVGLVPNIFLGIPSPGFGVLRTQVHLDDDQDLFGNQLEAILDIDSGSVHHNLLIGFEASRHADAFTLDVGFLNPVDLFEPRRDPTPPTPIPGQSVAGAPRSLVFAPYVIDQMTLSDDFQLLAGARLDVIDFEDEITGRSRDDSEVSPMFGAVYLPTDDVSVYGNYSRSFAPPSARAFGQPEPERSRQVEAGVKAWFLDRRARATAAVYHLERDNIAIPDDNGFTQQIGNQRARGFELELALEPGDGFRAVAAYAYNDAELTEFAELIPPPPGTNTLVPTIVDHSGNRPAFAPEHILNLWASKSFGNGLVLGLGGRYLGEQHIAEDNVFTISDSFIASAMAAYDWSGYRLSLNVQNLTDSSHLIRGFGAQSVTPGSPLAVYLRLSIQP